MKSIISIQLILAATFLLAGETFAQPVPNTITHAAEVLPAPSPYGEARVIKNIPYTTHPTSRQNFDLYLPSQQTDQPFPFVLWIHGGAWMMGDKDLDNVKYLVRHGYAIASVDYRFSTEAKFPAQIQDCNTAMNFILAHATNFGIDPKRFVVGGGSAGGHLALLLGFARNVADFGANPTIKPLAIIDFFGPTDFNEMPADLAAIHSQSGLDLLYNAGQKLLGEPVDHPSELTTNASPIHYVNTANPPVLILQGGRDEIVPAAQSRRLQAALEQVDVKNQLILVNAGGHDGPLFETPTIQTKVVDFLTGIMPK